MNQVNSYLAQENSCCGYFLFHAKLCLGRFLVGKKWLIGRTSKILLERGKLLLVLSFFLTIRIALFAVWTSLEIKFSQKNIFKNKSKRKRNFIYHFLVESKPHEKINLLIAASVNIYQTKKKKKYSNSNENMLFWRKTDETIWSPLPISEQFFHDPLFVQILKTRNAP